LSFPSDQVLGLQRVLELRNGGMPIAAANMSLGSGEFASQAGCDASSPLRLAAIANLAAAGVATVISAGNQGYAAALNMPACLTGAVSVGSTLKANPNGISDFSNMASFLTLLAPGSDIYSSVPTGIDSAGFAYYFGTSMAAPHVAGAWALVKQRYPAASVSQVRTALSSTGIRVTDAASPSRPDALGTIRPRIRVDLALNSCAVAADCSFAPIQFRGSGGGW
jgi:subtilisin family serine protease